MIKDRKITSSEVVIILANKIWKQKDKCHIADVDFDLTYKMAQEKD